MSKTEQYLVSKIIEDKDLGPVADAGITDSHFLDPKVRLVFKTIVEFKHKHGVVPSLTRIKQDYPNFKFLVANDQPWSDLTEQVREVHDLALLEDALAQAVEIFDADVRDSVVLDSVKKTLRSTLKEIEKSTPNMRDTNLRTTGRERWEKYEALRNRSEDLLGIPSGFTKLDQALQGFQAGQLIVFAGPPKAGKSTMMLLAAMAAHKLSKRPLVIGFEMSNDEQEQRIDAITAKVSHHRLRGGNLTEDEQKRLKRTLQTWEDMADFFLSNDTMSTTTLTGVEAKAEKHEPDLLIVDGCYMMQDENGEKPGSPQALTNITRGFKRMAQNKNLPIVITTQVLGWKMDKKRGVTTESIGYSSSFGQDADALVSVEPTDDPMVNKIKVLDARNAPRQQFYVRWDWETGEFIELDDDPTLADDDEYGAEY